MLELIMAVIVAVAGVFVLFSAFANTSTGSSKKAKVQAKPQQAAKKGPKKASKKELAAKAREEAEIDRLIYAEAKGVSGMPTDKQKVTTLEEIHAKKEKVVTEKKGANRVAPTISETRRHIEAGQGFAIVEQKKKEKVASPVVKDHTAEKDRDLTKFFKMADKKSKDKKTYSPKSDDKKPTAGTVSMKKKITADPKDLWSSAPKWEAEN